MKDFGGVVKKVNTDRCMYPYRLDPYGCWCQHDCAYCYAKSLLDFSKLWNPNVPSVGVQSEISKKVDAIPKGATIRLGGMTDCFMTAELTQRATYKTIKKLQARRIPYLIVTKGALVSSHEYVDLYDPKLAHFQISITSTDDAVSARYEKASSVSARLEAYKMLSKAGFDVSLRVSPYLPGNIDWKALEGEKVLVEFLRVNSFIAKEMGRFADLSAYTLKSGGYKHLQLEQKIIELEKATGFDQVSVCEYVPEHYEYWRENVNANREDCCNLRSH